MPANGNQVVDIEGMKAAQPYFEEAVSDVNHAYTSMSGQRDTLRANWTGEASGIFLNAMQIWLDDCEIVRRQLTLILEKLQANTHINVNTHDETRDAAQQVSASMSASPLPGF
jgi:uncharacterized protein YukE